MNRTSHLEEIVGVRYTGWAALDRDPQEDLVELRSDLFLSGKSDDLVSVRGSIEDPAIWVSGH